MTQALSVSSPAQGAAAQSSGPGPTGGPAGGIALVDLLDRLLGSGVVISGDIVISLAGVDLVEIRLHALIASVRAEMSQGVERGPGSGDS